MNTKEEKRSLGSGGVLNARRRSRAHPLYLGRTTLIRETYRSIINAGRTYAAFTDDDRNLVNVFPQDSEILDPMSGYGSVTRFCSESSRSSYCIEANAPQYFWQLLCHPTRAEIHADTLEKVLLAKRKWPKIKKHGIVADDFFPDECLGILRHILNLIHDLLKDSQSIQEATESAISILLPFVNRLACSLPGDNSTHTKRGGICVFSGWGMDFEKYLRALYPILKDISLRKGSTKHDLYLGDARTYAFPKCHFSAMITSPPYPNHRDFSAMFAVENAFLHALHESQEWGIHTIPVPIIGTNFVKGENISNPYSPAALQFLAVLGKVDRNRQAKYDDDHYYIPYFKKYFSDLEQAYKNIALSLGPKFLGFVIVVNNTHRKKIVPLSDVIKDIWSSLGFSVETHRDKELFHIGTKSSGGKGIQAKHVEYVLRIER